QMLAAIEAHRAAIERGVDREALQRLLPPGGARNALDCALWELEAQRRGRPVWALAGLKNPRELTTTFTLGADTPETMAAGARRFKGGRGRRLKRGGAPRPGARGVR